MNDPEYFDDEDEILDCPHCGNTYDDADADFLICSKCGFNANTRTQDRRKIVRDPNQYDFEK